MLLTVGDEEGLARPATSKPQLIVMSLYAGAGLRVVHLSRFPSGSFVLGTVVDLEFGSDSEPTHYDHFVFAFLVNLDMMSLNPTLVASGQLTFCQSLCLSPFGVVAQD